MFPPFFPPRGRRRGGAMRAMQIMEIEGMYEEMAYEQLMQRRAVVRGRMEGYTKAMRDMEGADRLGRFKDFDKERKREAASDPKPNWPTQAVKAERGNSTKALPKTSDGKLITEDAHQKYLHYKAKHEEYSRLLAAGPQGNAGQIEPSRKHSRQQGLLQQAPSFQHQQHPGFVGQAQGGAPSLQQQQFQQHPGYAGQAPPPPQHQSIGMPPQQHHPGYAGQAPPPVPPQSIGIAQQQQHPGFGAQAQHPGQQRSRSMQQRPPYPGEQGGWDQGQHQPLPGADPRGGAWDDPRAQQHIHLRHGYGDPRQGHYDDGQHPPRRFEQGGPGKPYDDRGMQGGGYGR
ncbi:hypothetical protein LTR37_001390 [Vermiconidia calcicola]|uniref:Uncharacterized protein n=1 Tax=Vermiconidia calcicola TaxID=1690605 RepID=A0ACC3NVF7_9PEZI|nr:hypothetical protein LTR37_001390 [Vermiconidia calcicola]